MQYVAAAFFRLRVYRRHQRRREQRWRASRVRVLPQRDGGARKSVRQEELDFEGTAVNDGDTSEIPRYVTGDDIAEQSVICR